MKLNYIKSFFKSKSKETQSSLIKSRIESGVSKLNEYSDDIKDLINELEFNNAINSVESNDNEICFKEKNSSEFKVMSHTFYERGTGANNGTLYDKLKSHTNKMFKSYEDIYYCLHYTIHIEKSSNFSDFLHAQKALNELVKRIEIMTGYELFSSIIHREKESEIFFRVGVRI